MDNIVMPHKHKTDKVNRLTENYKIKTCNGKGLNCRSHFFVNWYSTIWIYVQRCIKN